MSALTLPGSIPGLRRRGSPVYSARDGLHGTVVVNEPGELAVHATTEGDGNQHRLEDEWALSLEDPTGRVHAAWWAMRQPRDDLGEDDEVPELFIALVAAQQTLSKEWWTDDRIARFRDLCLKLAGVSP